MGANQVSKAALNYDNNVSSLKTSRPAGLKVLQHERRVLIDDVEGLWDERITEKLHDLVKLEEGWDGYRAMPVSFTNAVFALRMLEKICRPGTPLPAIVPGVDGDLQLEWHTAKGDIELHVLAPNSVHAWHAKVGDDNPDGDEKSLKTDFSIVAEWVRDIAENHAGA